MLRGRDLSEVPAETAAIGQAVLAPTDPYRVIGDRLADVLADADFASLYDTTGRPAISPALLALVTLFQFTEDLPDREAAHAAVVRLDWKYALHLPLASVGFDFTDLHHFRERLLAHHRERLVFDTLLERIRARGLVRKRGKQRTDSLAVLGAVRDLSRLELLTETVRLALRAIDQADALWWERTAPAGFRDLYGERRADYRLTDQERQAALVQAGRDGFWVLDRLAADGPAALRALPEVATLRAVWAQHFRRDGGRVAVADPPVEATERIVTPHDPGVRAGEKRGKKWRGEKVHVTETAEAGEDHFLTDVTTGNASGGDAESLPAIRRRLGERDLLPAEQHVDASYVSGAQLAASAAAGITLVGPPLADTSPQEFKLAHFRIEREARTAICPAGKRAVRWSPRADRDGSRAVNIAFAAADCAACPLRARCTTSKGGRSLHLSEHYELIAARRREAQTPAFQARMRRRAGIEATLSELTRKHGLRRHRYRGETKRPFENLVKGAACNLKRLVRGVSRPLLPPPFGALPEREVLSHGPPHPAFVYGR